MRELKFRVWDNSKNEWFPIKGAMAFLLNNDGNENLVFITKTGPYPIPQTGQENGGRNRFSVQQFTGLKDKNGNNIYEGDIIKETHFEDWKDETGYDYFGVVKHVVYTDKTNGHQVSRYSSFPKLEEMAGYAGNPIGVKCELVGNIFGFPCRPDHNGECLICDCWLSDCPVQKLIKAI